MGSGASTSRAVICWAHEYLCVVVVVVVYLLSARSPSPFPGRGSMRRAKPFQSLPWEPLQQFAPCNEYFMPSLLKDEEVSVQMHFKAALNDTDLLSGSHASVSVSNLGARAFFKET